MLEKAPIRTKQAERVRSASCRFEQTDRVRFHQGDKAELKLRSSRVETYVGRSLNYLGDFDWGSLLVGMVGIHVHPEIGHPFERKLHFVATRPSAQACKLNRSLEVLH